MSRIHRPTRSHHRPWLPVLTLLLCGASLLAGGPELRSFTAASSRCGLLEGTDLQADFSGEGVIYPGAIPITSGRTLHVRPAMPTLFELRVRADGQELRSRVAVHPVLPQACGGAHCLLLASSGAVYALGLNQQGQLGTGAVDADLHRNPSPVVGPGGQGLLEHVQGLAAGRTFSLALLEDGRILAWGSNDLGQLGGGAASATPSAVPQPVNCEGEAASHMARVRSVCAGAQHVLALCEDGCVCAWGSNEHGQLGRGGEAGGCQAQPAPVADPAEPGKPLSRIVAIAAGESHSLALREDGTLYVWGDNASGQLGTGRAGQGSTLPRQVEDVKDLVLVGAGGRYSLALDSDGGLLAWGANEAGQLGMGDRKRSALPRRMPQPPANLTALTAGLAHSVTLDAQGTCHAWGLNKDGQLNDGTRTNRLKPVTLQNLPHVDAICAGDHHCLFFSEQSGGWIFCGSCRLEEEGRQDLRLESVTLPLGLPSGTTEPH